MTVHHDGLTAEWLGYATLRFASGDEGGGQTASDEPSVAAAPEDAAERSSASPGSQTRRDAVVYVDPGRHGVLTGEWEPDTEGIGHPPSEDYRPEDGDVVCITHVHHYDPDAIERVASEDATIAAYEGIDGQAADRDLPPLDELPYDVRRVGTKAVLDPVGDVQIWTIPAYNEPDGPNTRPDGTPYHPEGFGCGFVLEIDGTRILCPGDTDVLPGHRTIDVSLFCPPIGQRFTMDQHEAAELAATIEPDLVLPIHYNTFSTQEIDSRAFAADVAEAGVPVVLDES